MVMATLPGGLTVLVRREPARDRMGDPVSTPPSHTVPGCLLAPGGTAETHDRGEIVTADWDLYAPDGADFLATDTVEIPELGITATVNGRPKRWSGAGVVVPLRKVTGG